MFRIRSLALSLLLPLLGMQAIANASEQQKSFVRPCNATEFSMQGSPEVTRLLTATSMASDRIAFSSCEAMVLPLLPDAAILQFHSPTDVDYKGNFTFVRATKNSEVFLIVSCKGDCASPDPDDPNALQAINDVLLHGYLTPIKHHFLQLTNLYLFLLDAENGGLFNTHKNAYQEASLKGKVKKEGDVWLVIVSTSGPPWNLRYSNQEGHLHLDSASRQKAK